MNQQLINDIFEWDVHNWSKALRFWEEKGRFKNHKLKCLEIGGRSGGLSLWLAKKGYNVICSDLQNPKDHASKLHKKHENTNITYQAIDALEIPFSQELDIVAFKSVLGGISRGNRNERKQQAINEIHKALKPHGQLFFAENLTASLLHQFLRKYFVKWGKEWNYLDISEIEDLFSDFKKFEYKTIGFFGAFGRNEKQRLFLGKVDDLIETFLGEKNRYILIGYAEK